MPCGGRMHLYLHRRVVEHGGGGAADRLQFERGWATKYATRKKTEPERYSQFDLD